MFLTNHWFYLLNELSNIISDIVIFVGKFITNSDECVVIFSKMYYNWWVNNINITTVNDLYYSWERNYYFWSEGLKLNDLLYFLKLNNAPLFIYFGLLFVSSTLLSLLLLSFLGLYGVFFLNLITILMFWVSTILYMGDFFLENYFYKINFGKWFTILFNYNVYFELYIDSISYSFMLLTITIATFVYIYIFSYFRNDANVERLTIFINMFVISMIVLVTSGNFFVMFLGWELIGLTSFFLINFWSTRISTLKSAFKAYVFNKFSDVCILIGVLLSFILIQDVNLMVFNTQISLYNNYYITLFNYDISLIEMISFFLLHLLL